MGVSKERAQNSAASSLKGATKRLQGQTLATPNDPLPIAKDGTSLPMFLTYETHDEPLTRWVPIRSVFPGPTPSTTDDAVREAAKTLVKTASNSLDSLPHLKTTFHLPSEWGGEIFGTRDTRTLAAYAAMDFAYVPVTVKRTHHFIDSTLTLPFPEVPTPYAHLRITSARIAEDMGLKGFGMRRIPVLERQPQAVAALWRIHDCLRDFLLEGELVRDDARRQFTATIKGESLFPWLADDRMKVLGEAFRRAYPRQARHGTIPSAPEGSEVVRRSTLPPSVSSED